jgi:Rieske 2Fe-2S family protein
MDKIKLMNNDDYQSGRSFPKEVLFDKSRMKKLFTNKWFFVGTRGDVPAAGSYLSFNLFENSYFLIHGDDGEIRCLVNRCAHQSARLITENTGKTLAKIMCPNHQWTYNLNDGSLSSAARMPSDFVQSDRGKNCGLDSIKVQEIEGMLFACLGNQGAEDDTLQISSVIKPYIQDYNVGKGSYKLAYHERVELDANWLVVMLNNRECCHCQMNHRGLLKLFSDDSFNGSKSPRYVAMLEEASQRWDANGLLWQEQAFDKHDSCRLARYPMKKGFKSTSFDGEPCSKKLIGPHTDYDEGTLSFWFNPNAWIHFASDHIATNWVLPLDENKCVLYTSWIVHEDAIEGEDYNYKHMTDVWKVTNEEDEGLCQSMTQGALSEHYKPGYFSADERHCQQFCDWYMKHSK